MQTPFQQICDDNKEDRRDPKRGAAAPIKPGMYLNLFHGRADPKQDMDDWGEGGPTIGPLQFGHTTYASEIKLNFKEVEDHDRYFIREVSSWNYRSGDIQFRTEAELEIAEDMVFYDGMYYGDWSFYLHE